MTNKKPDGIIYAEYTNNKHMINAQGIVQNNQTATDFIRIQKQYPEKTCILSKDEERALVEEYVEIVRSKDGNPILDITADTLKSKKIRKYLNMPPGVERDNMYYNIPVKLKFKKSEQEFREQLVLHNLQMVASIARSKCQYTRDFDNMYARGLYGLVYAANKFNPFIPVMTIDRNYVKPKRGRGRPRKDEVIPPVKKIPKIDPETGKIEYVKFNTYAQSWVFKYILEEFGEKSIEIDNNSVSIDQFIKPTGNKNSTQTLENFIDDSISPDYVKTPSVIEQLSAIDGEEIYGKIKEYIISTNELSSNEKNVLLGMFYNDEKQGDIAKRLSISSQAVATNRHSGLLKLKRHMENELKITSGNDVSPNIV